MPVEELQVTTQDADSLREFSRVLELGEPTLTGPHGEKAALPNGVYDLLKEAARNMQMGHAVSLVVDPEELTTQKAAEILGCSRPHLIKLLEEGKIPFEMVGTHRRIRQQDLEEYRKKRNEARHRAIVEMAQEAIRLGIYEGIPLEEGQSDV